METPNKQKGATFAITKRRSSQVLQNHLRTQISITTSTLFIDPSLCYNTPGSLSVTITPTLPVLLSLAADTGLVTAILTSSFLQHNYEP
jgi:hypothetical protein